MVPFIVVVALGFNFMNGFNDAANSIATIVSTRALSPRMAVLWAALFNFIAFLLVTNVAATIGVGIVDPRAVTNVVVLAGLLGAIMWDILAWYYGLPVSSSHALIGGLIGAAVVARGVGALIWSGITKTLVFMALSPPIGFGLAFIFMAITMWTMRSAAPVLVYRWFRRLQLVSSALVSLGHGMNDAQKAMGVIALLLFVNGYLGATFYIPFWVMIACNLVIAAGTASGGWRIVKTMGMRITKLEPVGACAAQMAAAVALLGTSYGGIPVSTTHTISGAIMGVGTSHRLTAVRWQVAMWMAWAWVLTMPAAAVMAGLMYLLLRFALG